MEIIGPPKRSDLAVSVCLVSDTIWRRSGLPTRNVAIEMGICDGSLEWKVSSNVVIPGTKVEIHILKD